LLRGFYREKNYSNYICAESWINQIKTLQKNEEYGLAELDFTNVSCIKDRLWSFGVEKAD